MWPFAAVLLSAETLVGGLPGDRLTISGPLGEVSLAQPAAQPSSHTPHLYAGTEVVEFSPTADLARTMEVVLRNAQGGA